MARIILALCLLISSVVSAQPGYTNINSRYKWIAGGFDSSLILPRYNGVPSGLRSAWNTDGQLAVDTANNRLYVYSGGAWVRVANYSDVGSTYTFPYSVVAPGNAIQLENDTTANPANYFYGRNSAGRRGWYPQSGITGVNIYNSDGTFTGYRTVNGNYNGFEMSNISSLNIGIDDNAGMTGGINIGGDNADNDYHIRTIGSVGESGIYGYRSENKLYSVTAGSDSSFVQTDGENGISIKAFDGSLRIPLLNYTLSTTGKKIMIRDTATGLLENIDPALIGGGGSSGITVGTTTITSGTNGRVGYNNSGVYGEKAVTGTGDVVLATSPTLVTPILGTPTSATLTNATGLPLTTGLTGGNWKTIYTNGSGTVTELALGSAGKVLTTNGTSSAPTWETPASGVTTMAAIGATPNANGATISGSTLNLQPVSASFGGVVTTSAQTLGAGIKTFSDNVIISNVSNPKLAITNGTQYTQIFTGTSLSIFQFPNSTKFGIQAATGAADNGTSGTYSAIFEGSSNNALFGGVAYNASITPSASLEVRSTTKGFLPPKMTGTQAEAIASPAEGLMIYSTDGSGATITSKGWWGYEGSTWVKLN